LDRLIAGFCSLWIKPSRFGRVAIAFKPSTLLNFHRALVQKKYRLLFSPKHMAKPGPKGPTADLIRAVIEMKQRNPTWGCPRIAEQINLAFGTSVDKDVIRRILALHYRPAPNSDGPSWLAFLGHMKDSLWSLDLFRCESVGLRTYWVLMVMDQHTRRIIGFGIQDGVVNGDALCRMFKTGDSNCGCSEISKLRQRSALSVSSMAGKPENSGHDGNQNCSLRSDLASVHRATDWNYPS
jgi:hypothetical protein